MKIFLLSSMMFFSIMMLFIDHPFLMGIFILLQTMMMCLTSGMFVLSYWFSYILFLTFSGGLLILFTYVSSIASNELFKISMKTNLIVIILIIVNMCLIISFKNFNWMNYYINNEMINFNEFTTMNFNLNLNLSKMYNKQTFFITFIMMLYLFITLTSIVKITNIYFGPLRSFN